EAEEVKRPTRPPSTGTIQVAVATAPPGLAEGGHGHVLLLRDRLFGVAASHLFLLSNAIPEIGIRVWWEDERRSQWRTPAAMESVKQVQALRRGDGTEAAAVRPRWARTRRRFPTP